MRTASSLRRRLLVAGCCILVSLLLTCAVGKLAAQQGAATDTCSATVAFVGSKNACPTAPMSFRIAISDCAHSSGSFDFDYMAVNQVTKVAVHRSADWMRDTKQWEQTENVPLACDEGIYDVQPVGTPRCSCSKR